MGSELTMYEKITDPLEFCIQIGKAMARSGMFRLQSEEAGIVVAMTCLAEQITPLDFLRKYHIIHGRPSMRSDAMLAEFRMNHGGSHTWIERSDKRAAIALTTRDKVTLDFEITWDEAQEAGWCWNDKNDHSKGLKDNWNSKRGQITMLAARVVSDAVRAVCPEVNAGVYTPEEVGDFEELQPPRPSAAAAEASISPVVENTEQKPVKVVSDTVIDVEPQPATEMSTSKQQMELMSLCNSLDIGAEDFSLVLSKRGASDPSELTKEQAEELLDRLRSAERDARGN